jgi:hypothetical protein
VDGKPITRTYAETRAKWEPLYEATQIKGDGEAHPLLSPNDEFADYGTWDKGNLNLSEAKSDDMLVHEYARSALALGLQIEQDLGTNPYKFGMIGSTDSHTSLATADEDNFFGKHSGSEPSPDRMEHPFAKFGDTTPWRAAKLTQQQGPGCSCAFSADGISTRLIRQRANPQSPAIKREFRWAVT